MVLVEMQHKKMIGEVKVHVVDIFEILAALRTSCNISLTHTTQPHVLPQIHVALGLYSQHDL